MLPSSVERVPRHTGREANQRIRRQTEQNVARVAAEGSAAIDRRLVALDREWDVERALEANAATAVLLGTGLGAFVDRRFFALPAIVGGFLLQHALQGWCPPLPFLRRAGFRTPAEIAHERHALKAIRGDFAEVRAPEGGPVDADAALRAARR